MSETRKIVSKDFDEGFVVIDAADYDEKKHKLFVEKPAKGGKDATEGGEAGEKGKTED